MCCVVHDIDLTPALYVEYYLVLTKVFIFTLTDGRCFHANM